MTFAGDERRRSNSDDGKETHSIEMVTFLIYFFLLSLAKPDFGLIRPGKIESGLIRFEDYFIFYFFQDQ